MSKPLRRFTEHAELSPQRVRGLSTDHPALREARTIFPTTVADVQDSPRLLVSGINQRKLGNKIVKGAWAGMPLYTLTLEERATCPTSCGHWANCYGNGMPYSRRHRSGEDLERRLLKELAEKNAKHPKGFAVRLHILGDFYSADYALLWKQAMNQFPALRVFGYTARQPDTEIGTIVASINDLYPDRWVVRFSGSQVGPMRATTVDFTPAAPPPGSIICPVQTNKTDCCGTCGLCWAPAAKDKTITFILHGQTFRGRPAA
jgi:hypothetical protein